MHHKLKKQHGRMKIPAFASLKSGYNVPSMGYGCDIFIVFELIYKAKYVLLLVSNDSDKACLNS